MDYSLYAEDWKDVIRPAILKRDNYKCSDCGARHRSRVYKKTNGGYHFCDEFTETWAKNNGRKVFTLYLQVAHLDHNKQNNHPSNLLTKCPRCHALYDKGIKAIKRNIVLNSAPISKGSTLNSNLLLSKPQFLAIQLFIKQETGISLTRESVLSLLQIILNCK